MERIRRIITLIFRNIYLFRTDYIRVLVMSKMIELLIVVPFISILLGFTLDALHIQTLTEQNMVTVLFHPLTIFIIILIILVILLFIYYEMGFYMLMAYYQQRQIPYTLTKLWKRLNQKVLYFLSLQSLLLLLYILLLIPLFSTLLPVSITQNIEIPRFIVDELLTSTRGKVLYYGLIVALFAISLRFIFTLPFFVINHEMTLFDALKASFKFSNKKALETISMLLFILFIYLLIAAILIGVILIPLRVVDEVIPKYGHITAAFTLTALQGVVVGLFGLLQAMFSQVLVFVSFKLTKKEPIAHHDIQFHRKVMHWFTILSIFAFFLWSGINYINFAKALYEPDSYIIGHRGYMDKGVENTLSSIRSAAEAGADMVEIDIQQTKDGDFVVFHDKSLVRLAGVNKTIYSMTLQELENTIVKSGGLSDHIPSFRDVLALSNELGIRLLIEVKPHGHETSDYVEKIVALIDEYEGLDYHYIQTLDAELAIQIHDYEPRLRVGAVHAVVIGNIPDYGLDFVAVEQSFATSNLIQQAKQRDQEFFVWTVNSNASIQNYLTYNTSGIITNKPSNAYKLRSTFEEDKGFFTRVWNKLSLIF